VTAATATAVAMTAVATVLKAPQKARTLPLKAQQPVSILMPLQQPPCWTKPAMSSHRHRTARAMNSASHANAAAATVMAVTAANAVKTVNATSNPQTPAYLALRVSFQSQTSHKPRNSGRQQLLNL
jgi:hypothetical protein